MLTTHLARVLVAVLICLVFPPLSPAVWAEEQSDVQFFAPTKESPYEGIPGRLRYNVRIILVEQDKQGKYIARSDSSAVNQRQLAATVIAAARYYAEDKKAAVVNITLDSQPGPGLARPSSPQPPTPLTARACPARTTGRGATCKPPRVA